MMNLLVELRIGIETLQLCVQDTHNAGFPVDNMFTKEPFRALPACL